MICSDAHFSWLPKTAEQIVKIYINHTFNFKFDKYFGKDVGIFIIDRFAYKMWNIDNT